MLYVLSNVMREVWLSRVVPSSWQRGRVTLIPKSGDNSKPDLMRDITVLNVEGRLFWSVFQRRLASFVIKNNYLPRSVQKAFLEGVAGCVEHTTGLAEAMAEARRKKHQVAVAWLDLRNAYGSVRHSMIQFALKWYHVPKRVVELFVAYLDGLILQVQSDEWKSEWFGLEIGVPKGCTASTIVFDLVFQLILDLHSFLAKDSTGYPIGSDVVIRAPAYADDVALVERSPRVLQHSIDSVAQALKWSVTMSLKVSKCRTVAFKKFQKGGYCSFDPSASLGDEVLPFIGDDDVPLFKYLGRSFQANGKEDIVLDSLVENLEHNLSRVDDTKLLGPMKMWIVDQFVVSKLSWSLMIHNFSDLAVTKIHERLHRKYRAWVQLADAADGSILYRSNANCGFALKNVVELKRRLQVVKWHIMKNSLDDQARKLYSHRLDLDQKHHFGSGRISSPCLQLEESLSALRIEDMVGKPNVGRAGLGFHKEKPVSERDRVKLWLKQEQEAKRLVTCISYEMQNDWVCWRDHVSDVMQRDMTWQKILWQYSDKLVRFCANAIQGTLPSPDNLMRWNRNREFCCGLCGTKKATTLHILCGCPWVNCFENKLPSGGRYTFRHNQVLRVLARELGKLLEVVNSNGKFSEAKSEVTPTMCPSSVTLIKFCKKGRKGQSKPVKHTDPHRGWLWGHASDWTSLFHLREFGMEENAPYSFPCDILATDQNPDGLLISRQSKRIVLVELTSPWEENMQTRHQEKIARYGDLRAALMTKGWTVFQLTLEVGARGFVPQSFSSEFRQLGMPQIQIKRVQSECTDAARRCSFIIFINRFNKKFQPWGSDVSPPSGGA